MQATSCVSATLTLSHCNCFAPRKAASPLAVELSWVRGGRKLFTHLSTCQSGKSLSQTHIVSVAPEGGEDMLQWETRHSGLSSGLRLGNRSECMALR